MLDDLFEKSKHKRHHSDHHTYYKHHDSYSRDAYHHGSHGHSDMLLNMARKLLHNKTVLIGIGLLIVIICAVCIWLISIILPYMGQILSMLEKQGIKGVMEMIMPLLHQIWEGSGK